MHTRTRILFSMMLLLTGSAGKAATLSANGSTIDTLPAVEKKAPNSNYSPAYRGQTRVQGAKTATHYRVEKIAEKISAPFAIVAMPDGRLMVTVKSGHMEIRDQNGTLVKKITGFPATDLVGQGGLLDVAFDPNYTRNKMIYWSFSEKQASGNLTAVAKGSLNEAAGRVENVSVIFRATPALNGNVHFGSRIVFDRAGNLLVSVGERSIPEGRAQAQLLHSGLGKVFRITTSGKPAAGNPFLNKKGVMPEIYSYGHRNPQGLDINPVTGELWEAEFGPRGGDEINIVRAGKNYGWPVITYGIEYNGSKVGDALQQKKGMEQPAYYWDPVISPSGICFYKGNAIPEWKNNLFVAALSGQHIDRLIIRNNKVIGEERLLTDQQERFRDLAYLNGKLYAITDKGSIYRVGR
ncbi:PQQ-dependent sugar dehydrogenase [Niabella drilacis]|uniref:Glucose/arabinose dehydrogenase, beta-propeller fold n=1 Tax=Niabella drilacis (strain DSM 25811 / CCM 8410 / CCUG 62505 / LMG 26954 / E90) TaxID=1285928 RepID=A0A1G6ZZ67_NIADE|nr:PQQ-dependent sugar dehydrogenase [Niabella drilacis]SDE07557.1 Glucose/arabinose dehydrogenase, beta-propeller fold [Niabella drilacis]